MATTFIELTEDEFEDHYPLVPNPFDPNACWSSSGDGRGCLFETYGEEYEFVQRQDPRTIWTKVDDCIISGFHLVNRLGFLISTVPVPKGVDIEVSWEQPEEDEDGVLDDED